MNAPKIKPDSITPPHSALQYLLSQEWVKITLLVLLCYFILFPNIGRWDLNNPDEPRYAQVAREMLKTGNYLVPHLGAEAYPHKPPLFFWLIALCSIKAGDVTAASARLPSALAALGIILLTYFLGRKLYNPFTGFVAGLILFTAIEFFWLASRAHLDMTLSFWIVLSLFLFYCGYTDKQGGKWFYLMSYFFMGLAVLTKGPVGVIIPIIAISLFLAVEKEFSKFKEIQLLKGLLIILGTVAIWLVPACIMGGLDFTKNILLKENLGIIKNSFSHKAPFYFFLQYFPRDFLPWTFFIPSAAIYFWQQKRTRQTLDILFPLVWFFGGFIFLSSISSKRNIYLLPLYPAAALMMARFWCDAITAERINPHKSLSNLFRIPLYLLFGILMLFSVAALLCAVFKVSFAEFLQPAGLTIYPACLLLGSVSLLGIYVTKQEVRIFAVFSLLIILMAGVFTYSVSIVLPNTNVSATTRLFVNKVESIVKPEDTLVYFRIDQSLFYFFKRDPSPKIMEFENLAKRMKVPSPVYCLMQEHTFQESPKEIRQLVSICAEGFYGTKDKYYLLVNRPDCKALIP